MKKCLKFCVRQEGWGQVQVHQNLSSNIETYQVPRNLSSILAQMQVCFSCSEQQYLQDKLIMCHLLILIQYYYNHYTKLCFELMIDSVFNIPVLFTNSYSPYAIL